MPIQDPLGYPHAHGTTPNLLHGTAVAARAHSSPVYSLLGLTVRLGLRFALARVVVPIHRVVAYSGSRAADTRPISSAPSHATLPVPGLTLGLPLHCDRNLITLLLQSAVRGLQVSYNGDWIDVEPVPNAFVGNFGHQLEIATNRMLKSIEHRAMTNSAVARTSVATFIMPGEDSLIGPAEELVGEDSPPRYRTITFGEFMRVYKTVGARRETVEKAFKI